MLTSYLGLGLSLHDSVAVGLQESASSPALGHLETQSRLAWIAEELLCRSGR